MALATPTTPAGSATIAKPYDGSFQHLAFMVDGAPKITELAVDLRRDLTQMPAPLDTRACTRRIACGSRRRIWGHKAQSRPDFSRRPSTIHSISLATTLPLAR